MKFSLVLAQVATLSTIPLLVVSAPTNTTALVPELFKREIESSCGIEGQYTCETLPGPCVIVRNPSS
jgi:hypothetical protein